MASQTSPRSAWFGSTLKGRRHAVQQMMEAVEKNCPSALCEILSGHSATEAQLTACLQLALLKRSDDYHDCVELLLKAGAKATASDGHGSPLIIGAAESGCHNVLLLLLEHGANVNEPRLDHATALHRAVSRGHVEAVRILLSTGARSDLPDPQGKTPAMLALRQGHVDVLKALVQHGGIGLEIQDQDGVSLLHLAVEHNYQELVEHILDKCPHSVDFRNNMGMTPVMLASMAGNSSLLELLLEHSVNIDQQNRMQETALLLAAKHQHLDCLAALVEAGADMDIPDLRGSVPLAQVIQYPQLIARLLELGACPNGPDSPSVAGDSPLMAATRGGYIATVQWLLLGGANPGKAGPRNKCPLQIAIYEGSLELVQLLFYGSLYNLCDLHWLHEHVEAVRQSAGQPIRGSEIWQWLDKRIEQGTLSTPPSLQAVCRHTIRTSVGCECLITKLESLPLPHSLVQYVQFKELMDTNCDVYN